MTMTLQPTAVSPLTVHTYGSPHDPAIIFLHGAGVSSWMWMQQVEDLQAAFYCITVDLPGSGDSYQISWQSFEATADQLAALIKEYVPGGKAHVVGLSLGGYAALYLLDGHPDVVESLIVSGVTTQPFTRQWFYRPLMSVMGLVSKWDVMINLNIKMMGLPDDVVPLYRRDSKRASQPMLQNVFQTLLQFTLPQRLHSLPHRVLAVAGDKEMALIMDSLGLFNTLPSGTARIVPDAHHPWNAEHPDLFTAMIRAWVLDQPLPDALLSLPS